MDQREWDYGARMSRERRAAESRPSRGSESPDLADPDAKWSSLTDTGSLQPSAEALDWQRRADAWAQQAEADPHQAVEPANRWSDVAATGRPTFPADGVGWRTETAEWRATGARWRQTTEWRSTTGSHGWRSTTEAWQSGDNDAYPPAAETPMAQPALSSTAWSDDTSADTRPAWQQFTDSPGEQPAESATPSWQQPSPRTPAESSPSWQQLVDPAQQQPSWNSRQPWQRDSIEGSATWTDASEDTGNAWSRADDGRHLVREDDRAAWRRDPGAGSPSVGRRRAPEPGSAPAGGTGWSGARSDADNWENTDNWAGHTDTGSIQLYGDTPAPPSAPSTWGTGTGFGSRNVNRRDEGSRQQTPLPSYEDGPGYQIPPATPYESPSRASRRDDTSAARSVPSAYDETPRPRFAPEDEQPGARSQRAHRYTDDEPGQTTRPTDVGYPTRGDSYTSREEPGYGSRAFTDQPGYPARSTGDQSGYPSRGTSDQPGYPARGTGDEPGYGSRSTGGQPGYPSRDAVDEPGYGSRGAGGLQGYSSRGASDQPGYAARGTADEPGYPSREAPTGAYSPPEPRAPRRGRPAQGDETATFSAVPMPAPPPATRNVPPTAQPSAPRSAPPSAPRSAPASAPRSGPAGAAGRAKYNGGGDDWRDQTGSWEAEPDTSSWVRDPDTGQWSRSEDDPRILAWRREAARREAMGEGPRALPPPPAAAAEVESRPETSTGTWRNTPPPPLPPGPTPRSAAPYADNGYGAAPGVYGGAPTPPSSAGGRDGSFGSPDSPGRDGGYGTAPSSSIPERGGYDAPSGPARGYDTPGRSGYDAPTGFAGRDDTYGSARSNGYDATPPSRDAGFGTTPSSSIPGRGGYDAPTGFAGRDDTYGAPPTSGQGYGTTTPGAAPTSGRGYGTTTPGAAPTSGRGYGTPPADPRDGGYGSARRGYQDDDDPYESPRGYGSAPSSSVPGRRDDYDPPRGGGYGSAPSSSIPARRDEDPYGSPRGAGYGSAPSSAIPARRDDDDRYDPPRGGGYGSAPSSAIPSYRDDDRYDPPGGGGIGSGGGGIGSGGRGYREPTGRGYQDEPGNAPRSGSAYGSASAPPYGGRPALPSAPRSEPYGGRPALPSAPRSAPGYGDDATTVYPAASAGYSASAPVSAPRSPGFAGSASVPASGVPQYDSRADRRGELEPYGQAPLSPEAWQPGPGRSARPDDVPAWLREEPAGETDEPDSGSWALEERRERARGSAVYREGGNADWRRDLSDQAELAEGESRRFGTSDYMPFRSSGSAAVSGQSNLSTTSTSLISPVGRDASAYPQRGGASWNGPSGAYERRPVTGGYPTSRKSDLLDPDDEEGEQESGGPLAAVGYTVIWYGVPVVLFVAYMLVVGTGAQGHALSTLAKAAPQFLISLVLSVVVAIGLRFVSHSWKAISVGLAAAVVGGGLATVLTSAITGNSLS
ncbi:hypothetical protein KOI35_08535 [Actinoplanes bogorensis]|uniref:Uncharacterized protein n=1 Tax=Paractinoplanes bogorensis TaxID=1610840 RepID=A0ABS5YJB6_9ACTN|nr:hypothetical protein [Actinoplanes bogorensis]MBU2663550.1 hypothetical protein [Actinoplanes bogorensis]